MLEAEAEERADYGADADADVPEAYAPGLLGFLWIVSKELVELRHGLRTLYHMTVTSMREGATADSKTPSSTLVVTRPAQFFAADVQTTIMPHCVRVLVDHIASVYMGIRQLGGIAMTYKDNHCSKVFCRRKCLHAVCVWELASQVRNVEYHGKLTELVACSVKTVS